MIKKDFLKLIQSYLEIQNFLDKLEDLKIFVEHESLMTGVDELLFYSIQNEYGENGLDWTTWWLFELPLIKECSKEHDDTIYAKEEDGTPIKLDTLDDLYTFLEQLKKDNAQNNLRS